MASFYIGGIPVIINKFVPKDEAWLIGKDATASLHVFAGPLPGENIQIWLTKFKSKQFSTEAEKPKHIRAIRLED